MLPDLYRLEATLAVADSKLDAAEQYLQKALEVAKEQGPKLWQLRAAIDFAQLKLNQQKFDEGRLVLRPVYDTIPDGDCPNEKAQAQELIERLTADHT